MTPAIPPDAKRVVLAAVVPCAENPPHHMLCRCFGTNECTVVTDIEVEQRESPFMVVGHDNPEGPSLIARPDGWYPVEVEQ